MNFEKEMNHSDFCEKYKCRERGGIRPSSKYPFIFLNHNSHSRYADNLDVYHDGKNSLIHYLASNEDMNDPYNNAVINHKNRKGVYHSIFLFQNIENNLFFIGEYELEDVVKKRDGGINFFVLKKVYQDTLDNVKVYFVEKTVPVLCLSEIGDRNDFVNGIYNDEIIQVENPDINIEEGDYLDSCYNKIDLNRIINTEQVNIDEQGIMRLNFNMQVEATPEERRLGQHLFLLSKLNASIQSDSVKESEEKEDCNFENAYLYTVNVGCALTNFLVLVEKKKVEVWAIDWGSGLGYTTQAIQNIKDCIEDIKTSFFNGNDFSINKLFISHADSDHYNRIDVSMINADTEVWVSGYNFVAGQFLNKLNQIKARTSKFKMPLCSNSYGMIKILHPNQPIVYGSSAFHGTGYYLTNKKNNVSPIIEINIRDKSCVFPGDIMELGWDWYKTYSACVRIETDIYIHSHHGSENGFITNIPNTLDCEYDTVKCDINILSTRSNAYPGKIPSAKMLGRAEYGKTYSTEILGRELKYYKTDILLKKVYPVYVK